MATPNEIIKNELFARMQLARAALTKVPKRLQGLVDYYDAQALGAVAQNLLQQLSDGLCFDDEEAVQAVVFEWFYDGGYPPYAEGYGFGGFSDLPDLANFIPGQTSEARCDFDGGAELTHSIFDAQGGFSVADACYPLYDVLKIDRSDAAFELVNIFTARMFYCMHLAMEHIVQSPDFQALKIIKPFYLFANNHDWSPGLIYALEADATPNPQPLAESSSLRVPHLAKYIEGIETKLRNKLLKEDYLTALSRGSPEALTAALWQLPYLKNQGYELKLSGQDLSHFCWSALAKPEYYQQVSFDALVHFLEAALKAKGPTIDYPLTFLFLNNPAAAYDYILERCQQSADTKQELTESIKNLLRWAANSPETRWENPVWSLEKSKPAQQAMAKLLADTALGVWHPAPPKTLGTPV